MTPEQIVDNVIAWCSASPTFYPFYWIDPSRDDAVELVDMAVEKGICGFKVIRNNGMPASGPALDAYRRMAYYGKPLTFHSGILYDGVPTSEFSARLRLNRCCACRTCGSASRIFHGRGAMNAWRCLARFAIRVGG